MSETNFQPIFDYIDDKITGLEEKMATKLDIQKVLDAVGSFAKSAKDKNEKLALLENKTERIEHWVMEAAEKTKVPYKP